MYHSDVQRYKQGSQLVGGPIVQGTIVKLIDTLYYIIESINDCRSRSRSW
jgi:hypothetical protein